MKLNFVFIFLLVVTGSLSAIYFKVDHDFYSEKIQWNESQSRSQLSALTHTVESEFENITRILDLAYPRLGNQDYEKSQSYGRFEMISTFTYVNNEVQFDKKFFVEESPVKSWGASYAYLALKSVKESELKINSLYTLLDPQRKPWLMLVVPSKTNPASHYIAILGTDLVQSFVDRQKGGLSTIAVVNSQTQVLGHSIGEYVGSLLKEDHLVQDLLRSGNASGSGLFDGLQGERVHGFYEQVNNSNLYVTISTPIRVLMADRSKIKMRFVLMGIGISLLGVALLLFFNRQNETEEVLVQELAPVKNEVVNKVQKPNSEAAGLPSLPKLPAMRVAVSPTPSAPPPPISAEISPEKALQKTQDENQFKELFNDKKLEETFNMIDELEPIQRPSSLTPSNAKIESVDVYDQDADTLSGFETPEEISFLAPAAPSENKQPPPLLPKEQSAASVAAKKSSSEKVDFFIARIPNIKIIRKASKLDDMDVQIRKPGELL